MKSIFASLWGEYLKIKKSAILWLSVIFFFFIPVMIGLMVFLANSPELSQKLGLIGDKAALFKDLDWKAYLQLMSLIIALIGMIGFGFAASWIFGREYSDRTVKDLLSLPTPRYSIVLSKFIAVFIWCLMLSFISLITGSIMGVIIDVPGWSPDIFINGAGKVILTAILTILLSTPVGFFASYGRGYLAPMGFVILTLIIAQFVGLVGFGPYFPWSIPALFTGAAGEEHVGAVSYFILGVTSILGVGGTVIWWRYVDQK